MRVRAARLFDGVGVETRGCSAILHLLPLLFLTDEYNVRRTVYYNDDEGDVVIPKSEARG